MTASPVSRPRLGQQLQALRAQALEFVRRGARLESAAAQDGRAGFLDRLGRGHELLLTLDRAGAGHDLEFLPADRNAARLDDRILLDAPSRLTSL